MFEFLMNTCWNIFSVDVLHTSADSFLFFEQVASLQTSIMPLFLPSHRTRVPMRIYQKGKCQSIIKVFQKHLSPLETKILDHKNKQKLSLSLLTPVYEIQEAPSRYHNKCRALRRSHAAGMPGRHQHGQEHGRKFGSRCSTVLPTSGAKWDTSPKKFLKLPQLNSPDVISFVAIRLCLLFHILIKTTQTKIICLLKTLFFLKNCLFHPLPLPLGAVSIARDITRQLCRARPVHNNNCTRASQPEAGMLKPN